MTSSPNSNRPTPPALLSRKAVKRAYKKASSRAVKRAYKKASSRAVKRAYKKASRRTGGSW
jgi:hypothetical protein